MNKTLRFETIISDAKPINPQFSKAKARILYTGKNRNNTYFSKEAVEKMMPTLFNIPVVGEYKEKVEDFGTHGGKIEISDEGFKWIETTKPYGVVPSDSEVGWETVIENDGTQREYLYCTVYLWTGRYPEASKVIENNSNNQSMEITVNEADWNDTEGYYDIKDAIFSALCILGQDVEPCFESANITSYSLNKEKFKEEFMEMVKELKFTLENSDKDLDINNTEEGSNSLNKLNIIEKFISEHQIFNEIMSKNIEDLKINIDFYSVEELEAKLKEDYERELDIYNKELEQEKDINEKVEDEKPEKEFTENNDADEVLDVSTTSSNKVQIIYELSHDDIRSNLYDLINPSDADGNRDYNYWIVEVFQTYFIAQDWNNYNKYFKFNYSIGEGDKVSIEGEPVEVVMKWLPAEEASQYELNNKEVELLKTEIEKLNNELSSLREFKLQVEKVEKQSQIDELFSGFSEYANEPEYQALMASAMGMEVSEVEEKLFALVGRKKFSFNKKDNKKDSTKIVLPNKKEVVTPYGVASKYFEE